MLRRTHRCQGQATTEYILIVILVAVLSIGIITVFGDQVRDLYKVATGRLSGSDDQPTITIDPTIAQSAPGKVKQTMSKLKEPGD